MKRCLALLFLLSASSAASAFESVPRRIASMNLTADEILVEIVPVDRLVVFAAPAATSAQAIACDSAVWPSGRR